MKTKTSIIFTFAILMVAISTTLATVSAAPSSATPTPTPTPTPAPTHVMGIASSAPYFTVLAAIVIIGALAYGMVQRKRNNAKKE